MKSLEKMIYATAYANSFAVKGPIYAQHDAFHAVRQFRDDVADANGNPRPLPPTNDELIRYLTWDD